MVLNNTITFRLDLLQSEIEEINKYYSDTLRDSFADSGLKYDEPFPYNKESNKRVNKAIKKGEALQKQREKDLYGKIFHFSQTFFSMKDYLKKLYPKHKGIVENFFSNEKIGDIPRKKIGNDLKHNPSNDLVLKRARPIIKIEPDGETIRISNLNEWFYEEKKSVEYCNQLYNE